MEGGGIFVMLISHNEMNKENSMIIGLEVNWRSFQHVSQMKLNSLSR